MALKRTILTASAMLAAAAACFAAEPSVERPVRSYSGRVQLHAAPTELELPRSDTPKKPELPDSLQSRGRGVEDVVPGGTFGPYINPPTRRERDRDKKARNWILPPDAGSPDKKESARTGSDDDDDEGWGWLANDVLEQQRKNQEDDEEAEDEDEVDISILPTERLMQQATGTSGLLTDSEYMRPPSVALARGPAGIDVQAMMAMDQESRSAQGSATTRTGTDQQPVAAPGGGLPAGPFTTPLDGSAAGVGSPWSSDARRENVLPQTTALMGKSKPEASGMSALLADRSGGLPKSSALGSPGVPTPARSPSMSYSFESSAGSTWGQMPAATPGRGVFGSLEPPRSIGSGTQPAGGLGGVRSSFGSTPSQPGFSTGAGQSFPEPSSTIPSWRR